MSSSDLFFDRQFDDWLDDRSGIFNDYDFDVDIPRKRPTEFHIKATGVTYGNRQSVIRTLHVGDSLYFTPEKNNPYDKNAILIVTGSGKDIGYVSKDYNKDILQDINSGITFKLVVSNITGGYDGNNLGVNIKVSTTDSPPTTQTTTPKKDYYFTIEGGVLRNIVGSGKTIVIPKGVKVIDENAFKKSYLFDNCCLEEIILPEGVTEIKKEAFYQCRHLKKINLPSTVRHIGLKAFAECESLKTIILPDNLKVLEDEAFLGCTSLEEIKFPNSLYSIGNYSFYSCKSLNSVFIPQNVAVIGERVFAYCKNLKEAKILSNIISIGGNPFSGCDNLKIITLSESVKTYFHSHGICSTCGGSLEGVIFKKCMDCRRADRF